MIEIRVPNITAKDHAGQMLQVRSYLYQLAEQLNVALKSLEKQSPVATVSNASTKSSPTKSDPVSTFNDIKALIIKSADIVNAYYEEINKRLSGLYVAESEFGIYREETEARLSANSTAIEQFYTNMQQIISDLSEVSNELLEVNAHIKTGLLYYDGQGLPVYGLEIGQRGEVSGVEVFNKYARFTSEKLSFYDNNDNEVAYFGDHKLYITNAEITGSFTHGGFVQTALANGDLVKKWMKGG